MSTKKSAKQQFVLVRSTAGLFVGLLDNYDKGEATLTGARRLWYWTGAASLSQLAEEGTAKPDQCKCPIAVSRAIIPNVMELLYVTDKAMGTIEKIPVWSAH